MRPLPQAAHPSRLNIAVALLGAFLLGSSISPLFAQWMSGAEIIYGRTDAIRVADDDRKRVSVVMMNGIRDGKLHGFMRGNVRFFLAGVPVVPGSSGAFTVDASNFLVHEVAVDVPQGMRFVASRRGSRYYPVNSRSGQRLHPKNRRYFRTAEEAEMAGYRPAKR